MAYLELDSLSKHFGSSRVLSDVSVSVEEGDTLVLLGRSGSGKTTLLRLVAGFERADTGDVRLAGGSLGELPPERRNFGMVFQHYALFPHLSVGENVAFGLEARGLDPAGRIDKALAAVDLEDFADRRVDAISGGQQQRVALARALAPEPDVLLLDEPLSNLDPDLRERTRRELAATLDRIGITAVWVTHEQDEAFDVGTLVAVLEEGRLHQVGTPEAIYRRPETPFVAGFVGRSSVLAGRWREDGTVELENGSSLPAEVGTGRLSAGERVELYVRPEFWRATSGPGPVGPTRAGSTLAAQVEERRFVGRDSLVTGRLASGGTVEWLDESDRTPGAEVTLEPRPDAHPPVAFAAAERVRS